MGDIKELLHCDPDILVNERFIEFEEVCNREEERRKEEKFNEQPEKKFNCKGVG